MNRTVAATPVAADHKYVVYAPTPKAIKNGAFSQDERLILMGDGTAVLYKGNELIQSDLVYSKPDSHIRATNEEVPKVLKATAYEKAHTERCGIKMPCRLDG